MATNDLNNNSISSSASNEVVVDGETFVLVHVIYSKEKFYFRAGAKIATDRAASFPGAHRFNYSIHSRPVYNGSPSAIAMSRSGYNNEFHPNVVKSQQVIPISVGRDGSGAFSAQVSPLDPRPQIFESKVGSAQVGWLVDMESIVYEGPGASPAGVLGKFRAALSGNRDKFYNPSYYRNGGQAERDIERDSDIQKGERGAKGTVLDDPAQYLRIFIQKSALGWYRIYPNGFGVGDYIGSDGTLSGKLDTFLRGE